MKKILYISYKLPSITTTFVYREIQSLRNGGYLIDTVSINSPDSNEIHSEALHFLKTTIYLDKILFFEKLFSNFKLFFCKPHTYISLLKILFIEKEVKGLKDRIRLCWHFFLAGYLYTLLQGSNFDQIHATFLNGPASVAFFLSSFLKIPFSFTIHASNIFLDPIMLGTKLINAKKIVTISDYNKNYLIEKYGTFLCSKMDVIHCGINTDNFTPQSKHRTAKNEITITAVGQLTKRKGFSYLLDSCQILHSKGYSFNCLIIGDGEERHFLQKKVSDLKLNDYIKLLLRQDQSAIKNILLETDIFCLPSIITETGGREGIPVALMEAMSMQFPVVSTFTVGIPELIDNFANGILVPPKDSISLANALEKLIISPDLRITMGQAARNKIIEHFNISNTPKQFYNIFG